MIYFVEQYVYENILKEMLAMENKQKPKSTAKYVIIIFVGLFVIIYSLLSLTEDKSQRTNYIPNTAEQNKSDFELLGANFKKDGSIRYVVGRIKNTSGKDLSYVQVEINLYDRNGNQIGSTLDNVNNLANNATWNFKAIVLEDKVYRYEIVKVTGY